MLGSFCIFLSSADFSKSSFSKNSFRNIIRVSNSLDPDQARHFVGPDQGSSCLQNIMHLFSKEGRICYMHTLVLISHEHGIFYFQHFEVFL